MPRKHYEAAVSPAARSSALSQECQVVYDVLVEEVNRMRREAGLPARTMDDIAATRQHVLQRLQDAHGHGEDS